MKKPALFVKLDLEDDDGKEKPVLFEVNKTQLKDILNNFEAINAQLATLTTQGQ
jgi:hypothetical protein